MTTSSLALICRHEEGFEPDEGLLPDDQKQIPRFARDDNRYADFKGQPFLLHHMADSGRLRRKNFPYRVIPERLLRNFTGCSRANHY